MSTEFENAEMEFDLVRRLVDVGSEIQTQVGSGALASYITRKVSASELKRIKSRDAENGFVTYVEGGMNWKRELTFSDGGTWQIKFIDENPDLPDDQRTNFTASKTVQGEIIFEGKIPSKTFRKIIHEFFQTGVLDPNKAHPALEGFLQQLPLNNEALVSCSLSSDRSKPFLTLPLQLS